MNLLDVPSRFRAPASALDAPNAGRVGLLGRALRRRDPPADEIVADFATLPAREGFRLLEAGLAHGPQAARGAPASLQRLLHALDDTPAWLEPRRMEAGAATLLRAGPAAGIVLGMKSLVLGYASPAGNKPLMYSGQLQERTPRRLAETSRFVQAVSQPGGMRRGGAGLAITVKVRLMHAQVRRLIDATGSWRAHDWGEPINQHDMLATVILFSAALVEGLRELGYAISRDEADDVSHLWRYVGHVMGVEEPLLPQGHRDGLDLADLIQETQGPPDDDSRALVAALFASRPQMAETPRERKVAARRVQVMQSLCRQLVGEELANQLGVPRHRLDALTRAARPLLAVAARANRLPVWRDLAARAGNAYWDAAVSEGLSGGEAVFAPPRKLHGQQG